MDPFIPATPITLGLFEKRVEGDDCLLDLASLRFRQAGMGAELYAGETGQLEHLLRYRPWLEAPVVVHLPREFCLTAEFSQRGIVELASRFAGRVRGFVLHDDPGMGTNTDNYVRGAQRMNSRLLPLAGGPLLFIEYAAGLEPEVFARCFDLIRDLPCISACVDTGHVGIWQARKTFARIHPRQDVCALRSEPARLPALIDDVERATQSALGAVLALIESLSQCGKPVHFHLHDAHPLSSLSPFAVCDHLSFLAEIPLWFEHHGRRSTPPMFGANGLARIVAKALGSVGFERVSLTLEIHPTFEELPLGDAAPLFQHWTDTTNARKMNHWLSVLSQNHSLLTQAIASLGAGAARRAEAAP